MAAAVAAGAGGDTCDCFGEGHQACGGPQGPWTLAPLGWGPCDLDGAEGSWSFLGGPPGVSAADP